MSTFVSFRELIQQSVNDTSWTGFGSYITLPNKYYKFPDHEIFRQITCILKLSKEDLKKFLQRPGNLESNCS